MVLERIRRVVTPSNTITGDWTNGSAAMSGSTVGTPGWWLDRLSRRLIARNADMMLLTQYYAGEHRLAYQSARVAAIIGPHFKRNGVNYCSLVVDKLVERMEVIGFRSGGADQADDRLWSIWQDNALDLGFSQGLREGSVKGEFSLAIWPSLVDGKPQIRVQDPLNVVVATDPEDRRVRRAALKRWFDVDMGVWYATLYMPDHIWKFEARTAPGDPFIQSWWEQEYWQLQSPWMTWVPRTLPGDEPWEFDNPLGVVPVIPFPNKPDLQGVGVSELRDILPIQDAINKINLDLLLASDFAAFPQKWAVNVDLERDDRGEVKIPWKVGVDRIFTASSPDLPTGPETKFGQFEAAELSNYIDALEEKQKELAVVSRMSIRTVLGDGAVVPSGEAVRAEDAGLVHKVKDRWRDNAEPLEISMRLAAEIAGLEDVAQATQLETLWRDPEIRTESEHLNALTMLAGLGVPKKAIWAKVPATPTEIREWQALLDAGDRPPVPAKLNEQAQIGPDGQPIATGPAGPASGAVPRGNDAAPSPDKPKRRLRVTRDASGTTVEEV